MLFANIESGGVQLTERTIDTFVGPLACDRGKLLHFVH